MMRIRAVRIDVETEGPSARFELRLDAGLVVISAPNSRGKSLLFQSIVYGLGLEGMYGPGRQHGLLTRALTEEVRLDGQTFEAVARLHIYSQYHFGRDTIAAIFTSGLLGEQFVGLEAGGGGL